jgi:predicted dehydrogenase
MHAEQIEAAVDAGARGILTDRPLAPSLAEADRIFQACRRTGVPMALGLMRRWDERYRKLQQLLSDGLIGDVTCVAVFGNTSLVYNGCQLYAPALSLAGDPEPVWAMGLLDDLSEEPPDSRRRQDPSGRGWVGLSNGAHLSVSPEGAKGPAFTVLGSEGRLDILNDTRQVYHWELDARSGTLGSQPRIIDLPPESEPFAAGKAAVRDLAHAVRTGGKTALDTPEAAHVTEIGFAIHASSGAGGVRVEIPVVDRALRVEGPPDGNELR